MSSSTDQRRFAPLVTGPRAAAQDERVAARAIGYAEGWASGQQSALQRAELVAADLAQRQARTEASAQAEVDHAVNALGRAASQLDRATTPLMDDIAVLVLEAAVALASAVLDAELASMDDAAMRALTRALVPLPADGVVTVRVCPDDHRVLAELLGGGVANQSAGIDGVLVNRHQVRLSPDGSLRRGEAIAEQAGSVVDARIEASLARALEGLRSQGIGS